MKSKKHVIITVRIDVAPELEDELNRWYDQEHMPNLLAVPGVLSGKRAVNTGEGIKFIAVYEHANINVQHTDAYRKAVETEWTEKMMKHFLKLERDVYEVMGD